MHGSTPKITHIYGDCILECYSSDELLSGSIRKVKEDMQTRTKAPASYPRINFLSSCYACNKLLEEGKDIYIYRGEKAFCRAECRLKEILFNEATEETAQGSSEEWGSSEQAP